jgi:hypothetical protein
VNVIATFECCVIAVGHDTVDDTKSLFVLHFDSLEGSHWDIENPIRRSFSFSIFKQANKRVDYMVYFVK